MTAIFTKFIGPTNIRGNRIKAYDCNGNSVTITYDHAISRSDMHRKVAQALCDKMWWPGNLIQAGGLNGDVFVFDDGAVDALHLAEATIKRLCGNDKAKIASTCGTIKIIARTIECLKS